MGKFLSGLEFCQLDLYFLFSTWNWLGDGHHFSPVWWFLKVWWPDHLYLNLLRWLFNIRSLRLTLVLLNFCGMSVSFQCNKLPAYPEAHSDLRILSCSRILHIHHFCEVSGNVFSSLDFWKCPLFLCVQSNYQASSLFKVMIFKADCFPKFYPLFTVIH